MPPERRPSDPTADVERDEDARPAAGEVRLSSLAGDVGLHEPPFHERVAGEILQLFKLSVIFTGLLTLTLVGIDTVEIWRVIIRPAERLVTEKVLMALIGATVVQVGAASAAIVYSLFRTGKPDDDRTPGRSRSRRRP